MDAGSGKGIQSTVDRQKLHTLHDAFKQVMVHAPLFGAVGVAADAGVVAAGITEENVGIIDPNWAESARVLVLRIKAAIRGSGKLLMR